MCHRNFSCKSVPVYSKQWTFGLSKADFLASRSRITAGISLIFDLSMFLSNLKGEISFYIKVLVI